MTTSTPTEQAPTSGPTSFATRRPAATLLVTGLATLLVLMSYTAPLAVLPQTASDVDAGATAQTWILNGTPLGLAALLLIAGSLADDYGRRRIFVVGTAVMAVASVGGALAGTAATLVVARVVQGGASAAILSASLGLLGQAYPSGPRRVRATSIWGSTIGGGIALGPLAAGFLTEVAGWRAFFWVLAAAASILAVVAGRTLQESRRSRPRRLDLAGVATLGTGLAALVAALTQGRNGWTSLPVLALAGMAAVLLGAFVALEARVREPMLDLGLFRRPTFVLSTGGAFVTGLAVIGVMSYLPTIFQRALHQTPLSVAGTFLLWSVTALVTAWHAGRIPLAARHQLGLGFVLAAAGNVVILHIVDAWSLARVAVGLVVAGIGSGLVNAALPRLALASVPAEYAGMGSGANNAARYVGSAVGVALVVAIVTAAARNHSPEGIAALVSGVGGGVDLALLAAAVLELAAAAYALVIRVPAGAEG
jgi:MFS family permease